MYSARILSNAVRSSFRGPISIEDVHFGYLKEKPILNGLTMIIPAGKKIRQISTLAKSIESRVPRKLLKSNKGVLKTIARTCFHPGASTLVPMQANAQLSAWEVLQHLVRFVWPKGNKPIKRRVLVALCLLIGAKLANVSVPFLYRDVVNFYNEKAPTFLRLTFDTVPNAILTVGVCLIFAYGVARASSSLMNELRNAVFAKVAQNSVRQIARNIFLHLHSLDLSFHLNRQTGALSKAIDRGTRGLSFVLSSLVFNIIPTAVEIAMVSAIFCGSLGPEFAYMTLGSVGMYATATLAITQWRTKFRHEMNQADNDAGNKAVDSLINYETVKFFNNEQFEADRYDHFLKKFEHASLKTTSSLALLNFTQNAIFSAGLIGVMYLAAHKISSGSVYREVRQGLVDMNTMFSLLTLKSKILERPNAKALAVKGNDITIRIEDVHFGYLKEKPILNGLTMIIPAGKKVAVVGGSGSGKSTLVRLLYRLYDADSGLISINGIDIHDLTLDSLRKSISVVPQDSVLFHDTIFYNLAYGNPAASRGEVMEASRLADLHYSVERMPEGYETIVGERGLKLSGGEKQRVAIARAILKNAPLIVYDEATSSLDAITEANIMRALKDAVQQRTSLFIAHRLATIVDSDIIYVLDRGRVAESGSHAQLIARGGLYSQLWNSQNRLGIVPPKEEKKHDHSREMLELDLDKCCGKPVVMSGCLDQISCNCNIDLDGKRNAIASVTAATLFSVAWWLMIDTSAVYGKADWNNVYYIITVGSTIAMFMVNAVSNSQVRGESLHEGLLGTKARFFTWPFLP
ncbi:ABC transporter, ATP-binding protein [Ancylostoma ceylanicum]|uniref:Iron-sulfur clusters transporter ABCB7, mitochondrial n=1 Tax=Ancylostoma ceylanicum TaxID=53326 RepID=A0A0D6LL61_9BILA|nr:ABC transporter, ATP-binding protein [Ancylostoma ceylanicum]